MNAARGVSRRDLTLYDAFYMADHFLGRKLVNSAVGSLRTKIRHKFLNDVRDQTGRTHQIERRLDLSEKEFFKNYLIPGKPVVFAGAALKWPCVRKWDLDYLSQVCGQDPVTLLPKQRTISGFHGTREHEAVEHTDFQSFIDGLKKGSGKYLRFSTMIEDHKDLENDIDFSWARDRFGRFTIGKRVHAFIGSKDSRTRLHSDFPPNLFIQVCGQKHWILFDPAYRVVIDPLLERSSLSFTTNLEVRDPFVPDDSNSHNMDRYETILEPGDILFNPAFMWHDVLNLSDSIGVSIRWLSMGIIWRASWVQQLLSLFATNPPVWRAGLTKRDFNKDLLGSKNNAKKDIHYVG